MQTNPQSSEKELRRILGEPQWIVYRSDLTTCHLSRTAWRIKKWEDK